MPAKLYSFYDLPYDHDICHLFEHVVIQQFSLELQKHGYERAFFGSLHGQTIDSSMFFDLNVYNEEIMRLFEKTIHESHRFSDEMISQSIKHIEAEICSQIMVTDRSLLKKQLQHILSKNHPNNQGALLENSLEIKETPKLFHDVAVIINVYYISEDVRKAFLCLYPVLLDLIRDAALDDESAYPTGVSALAVKDEGIGIAQRYRIAKDVDLDQLTKATTVYLRQFDTARRAQNIAQFKKSFRRAEVYRASPIRFYEETNIETTQEELANLITVKNLDDILQKMTVEIRSVKGKLKYVEWG